MQKFSIARRGIPGHGENVFYFRSEPNGNAFWVIELERATSYEQHEAETELRNLHARSEFMDCWLVEAKIHATEVE